MCVYRVARGERFTFQKCDLNIESNESVRICIVFENFLLSKRIGGVDIELYENLIYGRSFEPTRN